MSTLLPEARILALFKVVGLEAKEVVVTKESLQGKSSQALVTLFYKRRSKHQDKPGALNTACEVNKETGDVRFYSIADNFSDPLGKALLAAGVSNEEVERYAEEALLGTSTQVEVQVEKEEKKKEFDYFSVLGGKE